MTSKQFITVVLSILFLSSITYLLSTPSGILNLALVGCVYVVLFFFCVFNKYTLKDIGLSKSQLHYGLRLALPFMLVITVIVLISMLVNPLIFQDTRYQQGFGKLLVSILIIIPFQTVFLEEIIFRGILLSRLAILFSWHRANLLSAMCFGIWHIFSAQSFNVGSSLPQPVIVAGIVVATTIAGLFFGWLRIRSGSLVAPILIHWCINSVGVVAVFIAWNTAI